MSFSLLPGGFAKPGRPRSGRPDFLCSADTPVRVCSRNSSAVRSADTLVRESCAPRVKYGEMNRFSIIVVVALAASYGLAQQDSNPSQSSPSPAPPNQSSPAPSSPTPAAVQSRDKKKVPAATPASTPGLLKTTPRTIPTVKRPSADLEPPPPPIPITPTPTPTLTCRSFIPGTHEGELKDIQVGDFYFKRKNYKAALERYKEALYYKQNDAVATFRSPSARRNSAIKRKRKNITSNT